MKRTALKVLAVSRQQNGQTGAGALFGALAVGGIIVAIAYASAHPGLSMTSLLVQLHHVPHIEAFALAGLALLFVLLLQAFPEIALKVMYLVMIAAGPTVVVKIATGSLQFGPLVAQAKNALHGNFG
jgi:hypothetical protein